MRSATLAEVALDARAAESVEDDFRVAAFVSPSAQ